MVSVERSVGWRNGYSGLNEERRKEENRERRKEGKKERNLPSIITPQEGQ